MKAEEETLKVLRAYIALSEHITELVTDVLSEAVCLIDKLVEKNAS